MPINGANHKYKSLYVITIFAFICLPLPLCTCTCKCVWAGQKCVKMKVYWFPFFNATESLPKRNNDVILYAGWKGYSQIRWFLKNTILWSFTLFLSISYPSIHEQKNRTSLHSLPYYGHNKFISGIVHSPLHEHRGTLSTGLASLFCLLPTSCWLN